MKRDVTPLYKRAIEITNKKYPILKLIPLRPMTNPWVVYRAYMIIFEMLDLGAGQADTARMFNMSIARLSAMYRKHKLNKSTGVNQ